MCTCTSENLEVLRCAIAHHSSSLRDAPERRALLTAAAVQGIEVPWAAGDGRGHEGIAVAMMREEGLVLCHGARPWRISPFLSSSAKADDPVRRGISVHPRCLGVLDAPPSRGMTAEVCLHSSTTFSSVSPRIASAASNSNLP